MVDSIRHLYPNLKEMSQSEVSKEMSRYMFEIQPIIDIAMEAEADITPKEGYHLLINIAQKHVGLPHSKPFADRAQQLIDKYSNYKK